MGAMAVIGTLSLAEPARAAGAVPPVDRTVLPNGVKVLVIRQPHLPMVVVSALVDAGSRFDAPGKEGLASLTASLLTEGTETRSAEAVHDAIDFLGAKLSSGAGDDYSSVGLTVLKKDLTQGFDLFADVLLRPKFAKDEFGRKRDEALAGLEAEEQSPGSVAERAFRKALFGSGPYRADSGGWRESVSKLTVGRRQDVLPGDLPTSTHDPGCLRRRDDRRDDFASTEDARRLEAVGARTTSCGFDDLLRERRAAHRA